MLPSPLKLNGLSFCEFSCSLPDDTVDGKEHEVSLKCEIAVQRHAELERAFRVVLTTDFDILFPDGPEEYKGRVKVVGFFEVVEEFPEEKLENLVSVNGPAILYSATREMVSNFTSRTFVGSILLPSVTFIDAAKDFPATKQASHRTNSPTPKKSAVRKTSQRVRQ